MRLPVLLKECNKHHQLRILLRVTEREVVVLAFSQSIISDCTCLWAYSIVQPAINSIQSQWDIQRYAKRQNCAQVSCCYLSVQLLLQAVVMALPVALSLHFLVTKTIETTEFQKMRICFGFFNVNHLQQRIQCYIQHEEIWIEQGGNYCEIDYTSKYSTSNGLEMRDSTLFHGNRNSCYLFSGSC